MSGLVTSRASHNLPRALRLRGAVMSAGRSSMSRALRIQSETGSSAAARRASATWPRLTAHPAPAIRLNNFTFHQRGVCPAQTQPLLRPLPALPARYCRFAVVRRVRKAGAFSARRCRPRQRQTSANKSVMIVFPMRRGYDSGWSCNAGTAQPFVADAANAARVRAEFSRRVYGRKPTRPSSAAPVSRPVGRSSHIHNSILARLHLRLTRWVPR